MVQEKMGFHERPTQEQKILEALKEADGGWVNGLYFINNLYVMQYHARIFGLQRKGHKIEGAFLERNGVMDKVKSYKLLKD